MPEVSATTPSSTEPTISVPEKPKRNWKKLALIFLLALFVVSLIGTGLYLLIPRLTEGPVLPTQKQATPSAKIKPKTTKIVWRKGAEIWLKDETKEAEKVLTEDKKILDWDLLGSDKIVYITAIEKSKDEVYGTEIVSLDLKTKKKEILFSSSLESILAKKENNGVCNTEDPDISALAVSPDKKKLAFVQSGIWILDLKTRNPEQILKTSKINPKTDNPKLRIGECITYLNIAWVDNTLLKLGAGKWEASVLYMINISGEVLYSYANSSAYHSLFQLTYGVDPLFVSVRGPIPPENNSTEFTTATFDDDQPNLKEPFYKQNERVMEVIKVDNLLYFIDKPFNEENGIYNIRSFSLQTNKIENLVDLGVARGKCLTNIRENLYYSAEDLDSDYKVYKTSIYKFNLKTKREDIISTINGELNGCFQITSF